MPTYPKIAFVGLGVVGGAIAGLIRQYDPSIQLFAVVRSQATLDFALAQGIVDQGSLQLANLPLDCAVVFVCTPIQDLVATINEVSRLLPQPLLMTDVGSVKAEIVQQIKLAHPKHLFVAGHPMAGSEKNGLQHADPTAFKKATYILQPLKRPGYQKFKKFLSALGFKILELEPALHDKLVCYASHLPYLQAVLTMQASQCLTPKEQALFAQVISSGFRDTTRVASSAPVWGADIAKYNKKHILTALQQVKQEIERLEELIQADEYQELQKFFTAIVQLRQTYYS